MDLFYQALQTNGKVFSNFKFVFELMVEKSKTIETNSEA